MKNASFLACLSRRRKPAAELDQRADFTVLGQLDALQAERRRLRALVESESDRAEQCRAERAAKKTALIDVLTEERLNAAPHGGDGRAAALRAECEELDRSIEESEAVATQLRERLAQVQSSVEALARQYQYALSAHLNEIYASAMDRYNELAPALAGAVLEVAAIRRVMIDWHLGNSNGWSGQVLLPAMRHGEGRALPPLLDGAALGEACREREAAVREKLAKAGFVHELE